MATTPAAAAKKQAKKPSPKKKPAAAATAPAVAKKKIGRPSSYDPAVAQRICDEIAGGSNLWRLEKLAAFPTAQTIRTWLRENESFSSDYARARESRADARADRIDARCAEVKSGKLDPAAARVIIDAEKWLAAHEQTKRYGDRVDHTVANPDGSNLTVQVISFCDLPLPQKSGQSG